MAKKTSSSDHLKLTSAYQPSSLIHLDCGSLNVVTWNPLFATSQVVSSTEPYKAVPSG